MGNNFIDEYQSIVKRFSDISLIFLLISLLLITFPLFSHVSKGVGN